MSVDLTIEAQDLKPLPHLPIAWKHVLVVKDTRVLGLIHPILDSLCDCEETPVIDPMGQRASHLDDQRIQPPAIKPRHETLERGAYLARIAEVAFQGVPVGVDAKLREVMYLGCDRRSVPFVAVDQSEEVSGVVLAISEPRQGIQDLVLATERYQVNFAECRRKAGGELPQPKLVDFSVWLCFEDQGFLG